METETIENAESVETVEQVSPMVIYQQDRAAIDMQISTAKAYPRNIKRSTENALVLVTMDLETAETCNYSIARGGKTLSGPSVHLAKILAQNWGNLRVDAKVVNIDSTHVTSESVCFDLENNLAIKTQVKRSILQNEYKWDEAQKKSVRTGKMIRMNNDMITVTGNAANSIALRNAVLSVIPRSVVDKVYKAAKSLIAGDVSDKTKLIARRTQIFNGLKDTYSLTEKEILFAIGKAAIDHVTPDDLVDLIGIGQAIKDGDTTVDSAFRSVRDGQADKILFEDLNDLFELKKEHLKPTDLKSAQRIIDNKEEKSYSKLHKTLQAI